MCTRGNEVYILVGVYHINTLPTRAMYSLKSIGRSVADRFPSLLCLVICVLDPKLYRGGGSTAWFFTRIFPYFHKYLIPTPVYYGYNQYWVFVPVSHLDDTNKILMAPILLKCCPHHVKMCVSVGSNIIYLCIVTIGCHYCTYCIRGGDAGVVQCSSVLYGPSCFDNSV